MIGILVYCAFFVVTGFVLTLWFEKSSTDKRAWLKEEGDTAFWLFTVVFIACVFIDPWVSQALVSLFVGYMTRLYWVLVQLDNGENDDFEAEE
jgi:hypothetical protein